MIRGTTPTHIFVLRSIKTDAADYIGKLTITYKQNGEILLQKNESDISFSGKAFHVTLTQEETLRFADNTAVDLQVKVLDKDGVVRASPIFRIPALTILDEVELL